MNSPSTSCECGHEKRDHVFPLIGKLGYGTCKVCLCDRYTKIQACGVAAAAAVATVGSQP